MLCRKPCVLRDARLNRIPQIFRPFADSYLRRREAFPTANGVAQYFEEIRKEHVKNFAKIHCKMNSFGCRVLTDSVGTPILCEEIAFDNLQSFLYYDFFSAIRKNHTYPEQMQNCGRYFLLRGGQYYNYCGCPLQQEPFKTFRDVGSRRRYAGKSKNDSVWQVYNRAYKAHDAKYMKKCLLRSLSSGRAMLCNWEKKRAMGRWGLRYIVKKSKKRCVFYVIIIYFLSKTSWQRSCFVIYSNHSKFLLHKPIA